MSIYKEISQKFIMKNARTDWASYRSRLTDKLTGLLSAGKKESVMIVGAGRCNDIDLVRLGEAAGKIILADVVEGEENAKDNEVKKIIFDHFGYERVNHTARFYLDGNPVGSITTDYYKMTVKTNKKEK